MQNGGDDLVLDAQLFAEQEIARHMQKFPRELAVDRAAYDAGVKKWTKTIADRYLESHMAKKPVKKPMKPGKPKPGC